MNLQSVMRHSFSQVPRAEIQRSTFDRSHGYKTTFNAGKLIPVYVDEALPGDTVNVRFTAFARLATPLHPFMDNMFMDTHFFAVAMRLVWNNWERFNGAQDDPDSSTDYVTPKMVSPVGGYGELSIYDYMGLPTKVAGLTHVAYFNRAINLIWNQWFRDQNMQDSVTVPMGDGPDDPATYTILPRGKRHDYFTSCLPWPQKGPSVDIPLGTSAPVLGLGMANQSYAVASQAVYESDQTTSVYATAKPIDPGNISGNVFVEQNALTGYPNIRADLTNATAATINQLRQAFQVQKLYERDARGGTRYVELILSHFGVVSPDARQQRAEFLGGGTTRVNVTPVAQNSATTEDSPQGNLAGFGTVHVDKHGFTKSFTEHTIIIGFVSVRADLTYQQGLERKFSRSTRYDFFWPALAHIGEQAVLNQEIMAQGTSADTQVFGYQERFAEYRYKPSLVTGLMRSNAAQSLDTWHLSQEFSSLPQLNSEFIVENPPVDRVVAVPSEPDFIMDGFFQERWARPMPVFGVPGLIDHF